MDRLLGDRRGVLGSRLFVGLVYGVALYFAFHVLNRNLPLGGFEVGEAWSRFVNIARLVAWLGPLPLLFGLGRMSLVRLAVWSLTAIFLLFCFAWFGPTKVWMSIDPLINVSLYSLIILFIIHEFVQGSNDDKSPVASYRTYFENAWGRGFQVHLALLFLGAYWVVISLGAWMFDLIGLDFIRRAIFSSVYAWVSSGIAFAIGVHLADADIGLTRGARQIGLMLLSWLAVLMTLILALFLVALIFTGLQPLWDTGNATVLLLNAAATMILLINAAYQDGAVTTSPFMRLTVRFAALPMVGVVFLAGIGLWLRVDQYGLTPARVLAGIELLIVAIYAGGYLAAAARPGDWMAWMAPVNIGAAAVVAILLSALMTPVLSPARISVNDQLARLDSGVVEPDAFDFGFLASPRAGKYGPPALDRLAARSGSERDERIALLAQNPGQRRYRIGEQSILTRRDALRLIGEGTIPDGVLLPRDGEDPVAECLQEKKGHDQRVRDEPSDSDLASDLPLKDGRCLVRLIDIDLDGDDDALILPTREEYFYRISVLLQEDEPAWRLIGKTRNWPGFSDPSALEALSRSRKEERRRLIVDNFAAAKVVELNHLEFEVLGERIPLRMQRKLLNTEDIQERVKTPAGVEAPQDILVDGLTYVSDYTWCLREGEERRHNSGHCYGRYVELTGAAPEEFILIKTNAGSVSLVAYEEKNGEWMLLGRGNATLNNQFVELSNRLRAQGVTDRKPVNAAGREEILKNLKPVKPLANDLDFGGIRVLVDYCTSKKYC